MTDLASQSQVLTLWLFLYPWIIPVYGFLGIKIKFYGTQRFITAFTSACHLSLSKLSVQVWGLLYESLITRYVFMVSC